MKVILLSLVLLVGVVGLSSAQWRRRGRQEDGIRGPPMGGPEEDGPPRPPGGHGHGHGPHGDGRRGPPTMLDMFASCKNLSEAIRQKREEMWKSKEIGPGSKHCQEKDHKECMMKDMNTVRCAVKVEPSKDCVDDVMKYIQASACEANIEMATDAPQEWEAVKKQ